MEFSVFQNSFRSLDRSWQFVNLAVDVLRLIIVFTNLILNHFRNVLNKVTLTMQFKDILNIS